MDVQAMPYIDHATTQTDVYTNLQGLQGIKNIEDRDEALKKVAQQFESLFVNMMLKNMRAANAVFEKDSPFTSEEGKFYRDMLDQQRALTISHGRGLGIADAMYRQMSRSYGVEGKGDEGSGIEGNGLEGNGLEGKGIDPSSLGRMPAEINGLPISRNKNAVSNIDQVPARTSKSTHVDENLFSGDPQGFVDKLMPLAKKAADKLGVDHLVLIAQSALETGWGKHIIEDNTGGSSHNLFNIKSKDPSSEPSAWRETLEFVGGVFEREKAAFKVYKNLSESFGDYVNLVSGSERYQKALEASSNSEQYIGALQQAGYATDPKYREKVLSVYDRVVSIANTLERKGREL